MTRSRIRLVLGLTALATAVLLPFAGLAGAQEVPHGPDVPVPPFPVAPGLPAPFPPSSAASGGTVAPDLALQVLTTATQDPTAITVAPDGRVLFSERTGAIKVITADGTLVEAGRIISACVGCPDPTLDEGGVHGIEVAPDFATTGRFYVYYAVPFSVGTSGHQIDEGTFRLSTFALGTDHKIVTGSEQVLLENPAEWLSCCHYGGDIDFMPDGTVLLSVGDDTSPRAEGFNPRDERPGLSAFNAERTAQNPLDRRGKVLRLMPDGSVPDGSQAGIEANPHVGDAAYDPYIYAMGFRSDYRIAVDSATGFTFVGNVGPDASADDPNRGPRGYDELETIPPGGGTNHGWPRCIGNNIAYRDYDYATSTPGEPLSCEGMEPATIWYPYGASPEFPELGSAGGRTAIAGVVYRYDGDGANRLPDVYQGQLFFLEWSRDTAWTIPIIEGDVPDAGQLDLDAIELVATDLMHPIDAAVGPDGAIYLAEYGSTFYGNPNSRISRIVPATATAAAAVPAPAPISASDEAAVPMASAGLGLAAVVLLAPQLRRRRLVP